jgi:membrane protein implicated in regulation of membrane protease activity
MFVAVAIIGFVLLGIFLVFDDVLDSVLPESEWLSGPAIAAFLAAFGIVGWMLQEGTSTALWVAVVGGVVAGLALGYLTFRLARLLMNSPTDAVPQTGRLVGAHATVVTPVRAGGLGEVLIRSAGQPTKLTATADSDLEVGATVVVVEVLSDTKVNVERSDEFWT